MLPRVAAALMVAAVALSVSPQRAFAVENKSQGRASEDSAMKSKDTTPQDPSVPKPSSKVKVYLASPLGFAESTKPFMEQKLKPALERTGVEVEDPWVTPPALEEEISKEKKISDLAARRVAWTAIVQKLGARNADLIDAAQGVVAVLDGVDVDSGTAAEIGFAAAKGKWVIGYRGDFRRTGEDETAEVNLQVEYFILKNGGRVVHSLEELQKAVATKIQGR